MDEGLLNDLLECSVCLERLDTSSRVLPCQHTFCLKCLKVIVESHKELRCPECRVLVEAKVEELPPNVLLMRILEGMKNSVPRKPIATQRMRIGHSQAQQAAQSRDGKQLPPHARAMHDYISKEMGDLSFKKGEIILLQKKIDPYWYHGECSGRTGIFPITYVQVVVPLQVPTALCKALYDFRMSAPDEEGCLAFDKGAIITVHRRVDENWAEGRLEQKVGIFPIAFVELNQAARMLMNRTPLNRAVPPVPEHAKAGHSDHRHHAVQHLHRYQPMSTSMPTTAQSNYQNMATMSQSHPNYQPTDQPVSQQVTVSHGVITTAPLQRTILEPTQTKHSLDLIHFSNIGKGTMTVQSVPRIGENYDRIRGVKFDYNSTPVHKVETTYQNVRTHEHFPVTTANFTNVSSDSSSSMNTPSVGSTTTPNTSSNTSTCESAEPSLPSSPDNNTERNATVVIGNTTQNQQNNIEEENNEIETSINTSMGVLSLNESSTATNTSLNVSLPPAESPKLNTSAVSNTSQAQEEVQESTTNNEPSRLELPSSSKGRCCGPESLLNFGLGLQAALSPSHACDAPAGARLTARDKRHSLTPADHSHAHHNLNRHSAEILATSLLDHSIEQTARPGERRRRRERSAERPLPAAYVAVYPYKPQKPDELELKKGGVYTVSERCRDGWFKGWCVRSQRHGVFPGNYVAPHHQQRQPRDNKIAAATPAAASPKPTPAASAQPAPPDAPPRAHSPANTNPVPLLYSWNSQAQTQSQQSTPRIEKSKEKCRAEKSSISTGVSLMKRLAAMKKCKSPPPPGYSMDNPVFEDGPGTSLMLNLANQHHPVHVRSGSCPSQLLRALPGAAPAPAPPAERRHKERHHEHLTHRNNDGPWHSQHRKSQSLDVTATRRDRHHSQTVKERFRCIVPYPPNSEYELELKVDDIVIVSKKRGDGWYKGTLQRTGRTGLFPASFVQSCPQE